VIRQLEIRLEEERLSKVAAQNERDEAYSKLLKLQSTKETDSPDGDVDLVDLYNKAKGGNVPSSDDKSFERISNTILQISTAHNFREVSSGILNRNAFSKKDGLISLLLREILIQVTEDINDQSAGYSFTEEGFRFLKYWNNLDV